MEISSVNSFRKRVSTLVLVVCLASAFAVGQTTARQPANEAQPTAGQNVAPERASQNDKNLGAPQNDKKKDRKKAKHDAKPAPSKEEQEFQRVLMGIYG